MYIKGCVHIFKLYIPIKEKQHKSYILYGSDNEFRMNDVLQTARS